MTAVAPGPGFRLSRGRALRRACLRRRARSQKQGLGATVVKKPLFYQSSMPYSNKGLQLMPTTLNSTGPPGFLDLIFGRNLIKTHLCVEVNSVVTVAMVVVVVDGVVAVLVAFGNFEVVLGNVEVTFGMEVDVVVSSDVSFLVSSLLNFSEFCTMYEK